MPIKPLRLRLLLWRWHRRIGVLAALFVVLLSITGILLNHTERFSLSDHPLPASLQRFAYGVDASLIDSYLVDSSQGESTRLLQFNDYVLMLGERTIDRCAGPLVGAIGVDQMILIGCESELILTTQSGDVVERIDAFVGLPLPIDGVGRCDRSTCFSSGGQRYRFDADAVEWQALGESDYLASGSNPLDEAQVDAILAHYTGSSISWERFVLDVHSGRILGDWGVLLMDIMAILFMVLGITGVYMWWLRQSR